jgi:hypothetical protein
MSISVYWRSPSRREVAGKQRNLDTEFFVLRQYSEEEKYRVLME